MREKTAGADAGIIRNAFHDADQDVALAVELGDRTARVPHAGAGADWSAALGVDEAAVFAVGNEAGFLQAGRMHALTLMRRAVARDGEGSVGRPAAGFNRHDARREWARQRELRDLAGRAVAGDGDLPPGGDHVKRPGSLDAV